MYRTASDLDTHLEPWASVFRLGLYYACENVCGHLELPGDPWKIGVRIFDRLTPRQQTAMLATVGRALLDPAIPPPELTAVVEATTAAILEAFKAGVIVEAEMEWEEQVYTNYRDALLAVHRPGWTVEELGQLPEATSVEVARWEELADCLFEEVLFDFDFEDEHLFMDLPPEQSEWLKDEVDVPSDYFLADAPELKPEQLVEHVQWLATVTGLVLDVPEE